jgi:uncharacterized membrane protein (DUF373 family)
MEDDSFFSKPAGKLIRMTNQEVLDRHPEPVVFQAGHIHPRKYLEVVQDLIVLGLCAGLFAAMIIKLFHMVQVLLRDTDFSALIADILFILVLIELYRLLIIYLEEHRVSVSTMVEVGIVSTLREVILKSPMEVDWLHMLVLCAFLTTLGMLLRYAGIKTETPEDALVRKGEEPVKGPEGIYAT